MKIKLHTDTYQLIGQSAPLLEVLALVEKAADTDSTVVISGETGTGKEVIARALHHNSKRKKNPFWGI